MWSGAAHASSFDELSSQNCDDAPEPLLKQCVHAQLILACGEIIQ